MTISQPYRVIVTLRGDNEIAFTTTVVLQTTVHTYEPADGTDGPTLYVQAAQHGREINGTEVLCGRGPVRAPDSLVLKSVEDNRVGRRRDDPERDQRGLAAGHVREHERAVRRLAVQLVELVRGEARDGGDGVDNGVAGDACLAAAGQGVAPMAS